MATSDAVETVQKLVALAQSVEDGEPTQEARTAAVKAIKLMKENDLVVVAKADMEAAVKAVEGVENMRKRLKKAKQDGMVMGALGALIFKGKL